MIWLEENLTREKCGVKFSSWVMPMKQSYVYVCFSWLWTLFFLIEFIGLTSVRKTRQVSSAQLNKTSSAPCIVCPSPQAKSLSVPIPPALPTSTRPHRASPLAITTLLSVSVYYVYMLFGDSSLTAETVKFIGTYSTPCIDPQQLTEELAAEVAKEGSVMAVVWVVVVLVEGKSQTLQRIIHNS